MKDYFVKITFYMPCPRIKEVRIKASRISIAIKRAIDEARQSFKGRPLKEISIIAKQL